MATTPTSPAAATPTRLGLVAGRGQYPLLFCAAARARGIRTLVVALHGETEASIATLADEVVWLQVGKLDACIQTFAKAGVYEVVFAGQIRPSRLFEDIRPDFRAVKLLATIGFKGAHSIFGALVAEFAKDGVRVLPAITCLEDHLATVGVLGRRAPDKGARADLEIGRRIARELARLDVGQTVVVKNGVVLALEAHEGTDAAITRGGALSKGGGITVVKVARPAHDLRFDVPCIGLQTVATLQAAGAKALGVHAGMLLLLDRPAVIAALDAAKIAIVGLDLGAADQDVAAEPDDAAAGAADGA